MKRLIRSEGGTSAVEFAIVAPVLIFLLIGLIDVGRYTYYGILAANAARAGAQYGAQSVYTAIDSPGMQNAALADGQNLPNWTDATGSITAQHLCSVNGATPATCAAGTPVPNSIYYVKVEVNGQFSALIKYPGIPASIPVSGSAFMRVASQ